MDYKIHKSELIVDNQNEFVNLIDQAYDLHQEVMNGEDSTWSYYKYNFFTLTAPSQLSHKLFIELKNLINEYIPSDQSKWIQCWINYHYPRQVLNWHNHEWDYHGYISIDPKKSRTVFNDYEIENQVGNIYIGPGYREHKVVVDEDFDTPRITLGFDIYLNNPNEEEDLNEMFSLIPIDG